MKATTRFLVSSVALGAIACDVPSVAMHPPAVDEPVTAASASGAPIASRAGTTAAVDPSAGRAATAAAVDPSDLAPPGNEALRTALLRMADDDQTAREAVLAATGDISMLEEAVRAIDDRNRVRLEAIVGAHGWPGWRLVGEDGARAAWLLVQHAGRFPAFQASCLVLLEAAVARGDASPIELANLTDRVRIAAGEGQVYGTQFKREGGLLVPFPIDDIAHLNERREKLGFAPILNPGAPMVEVSAPVRPPLIPPRGALDPAAGR